MKKKITSILLITFSFVFSQIENGKIEYKISIIDDGSGISSSPLASYFKSAQDNAKYVSCTLLFNKKESLFFEDNQAKIDNHDTVFALSFSGVKGVVYNNSQSSKFYKSFKDEDFGDLILETDRNIKWNVTTKSKIINNFLCYCAIGTYTIENSKGIFKREAIAWFCPSIPVPFGPEGYGSLPGLILELQDKMVVFNATKIIFNQTNNKIERPTIGKPITEIEYGKMIEKQMEEMK